MHKLIGFTTKHPKRNKKFYQDFEPTVQNSRRLKFEYFGLFPGKLASSKVAIFGSLLESGLSQVQISVKKIKQQNYTTEFFITKTDEKF